MPLRVERNLAAGATERTDPALQHAGRVHARRSRNTLAYGDIAAGIGDQDASVAAKRSGGSAVGAVETGRPNAGLTIPTKRSAENGKPTASQTPIAPELAATEVDAPNNVTDGEGVLGSRAVAV